MKVAMMMRDTEYRDALTGMMTEADQDILIEIAGAGGAQRESVILTDIHPSEIEGKSLARIRDRTLFLSSVPVREDSDSNGCSIIFKYSSVSTIMAELSLVYSKWSGNTGSITAATRIIAVTGETDHLSAFRCTALARQIVYRHGGSILILPLGYVSEYRHPNDTGEDGWFRRLMYLIDEGRDYPPDSFAYTDTYGISYLKLPEGINPLTGLDIEYLYRLISSMGSHFDTVILDIGSCYSAANCQVMKRANSILFFGSGRRIENPAYFLGDEYLAEPRIIRTADPQAEARELDDFVSEIYGRTD